MSIFKRVKDFSQIDVKAIEDTFRKLKSLDNNNQRIKQAKNINEINVDNLIKVFFSVYFHNLCISNGPGRDYTLLRTMEEIKLDKKSFYQVNGL